MINMINKRIINMKNKLFSGFKMLIYKNNYNQFGMCMNIKNIIRGKSSISRIKNMLLFVNNRIVFL